MVFNYYFVFTLQVDKTTDTGAAGEPVKAAAKVSVFLRNEFLCHFVCVIKREEFFVPTLLHPPACLSLFFYCRFTHHTSNCNIKFLYVT